MTGGNTAQRPVLKYTGSKWRMADWIISLMPPHRSYLEPFFGSGACRLFAEMLVIVGDADQQFVLAADGPVVVYCYN